MTFIQRPPEPPKKESIKTMIESEMFNEMMAYCKWANIAMDYFIEQATVIVFKKDKNWKE